MGFSKKTLISHPETLSETDLTIIPGVLPEILDLFPWDTSSSSLAPVCEKSHWDTNCISWDTGRGFTVQKNRDLNKFNCCENCFILKRKLHTVSMGSLY